MRVLIVTSMYPIEELPYLGVFVAEQVRSLQAAGVHADVIFINAKKTRLNYVLGLPRVLQKLHAARYDAIHTHHTYTVPMVDLARRLARCRTPIILTNHEGETLDRMRRTRTWHLTSRIRHSLGLKRFIARRADFVIFVSRALSNAIATNGRHENGEILHRAA